MAAQSDTSVRFRDDPARSGADSDNTLQPERRATHPGGSQGGGETGGGRAGAASGGPAGGSPAAGSDAGPVGELRAAVVQDAESGRVLMLGWMDDEALRRTRESGEAHFWSRSRHTLWRKGETSGATLAVEELREDCDGDAILLCVRPNGPTCHTGSVSCFAPWLWRVVADRARRRPEGSYVAGLLDRGVDACAQKVGEEGVEVALAGAAQEDERLVAEVADLWFHTYVLLAGRGLDPAAVEEELARRHLTPS